jgi:hypothetical protein
MLRRAKFTAVITSLVLAESNTLYRAMPAPQS